MTYKPHVRASAEPMQPIGERVVTVPLSLLRALRSAVMALSAAIVLIFVAGLYLYLTTSRPVVYKNITECFVPKDNGRAGEIPL